MSGIKIVVFIITLAHIPFLYGQIEPGDSVKYEPGFKFTDGIYLNFEQVSSNNPIPKSKILTSADYNDRDFFNKVFEGNKIYYYDEMGLRKEVDKSALWGYSRNGVLYIQVQENFFRITFMGNICHFVADVTSYDPRYYGNYPYSGYYDPYYNPYNYYAYGGYNPYSYGYPYRQATVRTELKQYIIDFDTGKLYDSEPRNVAILLMKDIELHEEYVRLSRKKQKQLMFVYIFKFNERNPLYLPSKK